MKKKLLFIMPSMFIGGAERSLLGLLEQLDYEKYDVDLFLKRHEGEFFKYIPDKVNLLKENEKYRTFDVPIKGLLKTQPLFAVARIISKIALRLHCIFTGEKAGVWMCMQYTSKFLCPLLPKIEGEYDAAISFLGVPDILLSKVNAKIKIAWNHTDYRILGPCKKYDLKIYSKIDYVVSVSEQCTKQFLSVYPQLQKKAVTVENLISREMIDKLSEESV
ncbi:MAG: glycosyltransferase, partial [Acutalibacteraceae bacterium]